ncbi:HNH endonuclease signature motif containing protein [Kamptonema cortianum]|nr:HNH endonuclease signature motif containing protein [Oscillatoria laete-virens]MDK3157118.1 HNH endonuclease signature motif containing protein [Kamptonema cortianum]MDL5051093.1 HNH endonuclease signature motif containing protein [Oscillatoria amoena NRMC-F 0135]MDL5055002.1 HNH endonuclease signature motif containing protein [Oscillatoria laete-virens NRMC-F 0139]
MKPDLNLTNREIASYWATQEDECGLAVDWAEAHERCWRCGYKGRLQKCHIIPKSRNGSYSIDNLVLLCRRCHREAPNIGEKRYMWIWLRSNAFPFYNFSLYYRAIVEFEHMFGRRPFEGMGEDAISKARDEVIKIFDSTIVHWGEGRRNPSTLACIFAKIEESLTGLHPTPRSKSWLEDVIFPPQKRLNQKDNPALAGRAKCQP